MVYDFDRIQLALILQIIGKKLLLLDMSLFNNVQFIGETFSKQGKYSDYITQIRKFDLNHPIPNLPLLENKFRDIKEKSPGQFYLRLKEMLGSLERLMIVYKSIPQKNITLSQYVSEHRFNGISSLITQEEPIKDYGIKCIISLYEWAEKLMSPIIWKVIPDAFRENLTPDEKKQVQILLKKMNNKDDGKTLPSLEEFETAITRFASRCLLVGEFNEQPKLKEWLPERSDFCKYPKNDDQVDFLIIELPDITLFKILHLHELIQEALNPPEVAQNNKKQDKDIIPNKVIINRPVKPKKGNFINYQ